MKQHSMINNYIFNTINVVCPMITKNKRHRFSIDAVIIRQN